MAKIWEDSLGLKNLGGDENFFELGGHSLAAIHILANVNSEFGVQINFKSFFKNPNINSFVKILQEKIHHQTKEITYPLARLQERSTFPLSIQQEQVWFFQKYTVGVNPYHAQTTIRILGDINYDILEKALDTITERHEILRTVYDDIEGKPYAKVLSDYPTSLRLVDLSLEEEGVKKAMHESILMDELSSPFNLKKLPLARWTLVKLNAQEYDLLLVEHHIVHDGWTFSILMKELEDHYNAILKGEKINLNEFTIQYGDFADWQKKMINSTFMNRQLEYWKSKLQDAPQKLVIPTDWPRPAQQTFRGDWVRSELPSHLAPKLRALCQQEGTTLFSVMFTAYVILMHKYTQETDLCIGSALAAREFKEIQRLIGMFVNSVVIRTKIVANDTLKDVLHQVHELVLEASTNQSYPFPALVQKLGIERNVGHNPIFQTMFSFHDSSVKNPVLGNAYGTISEQGNASAKQDIDIVIIPCSERSRGDEEQVDHRIKLIWEYNMDLFERSTMERMLSNYYEILEMMVKDIGQSISSISMITSREMLMIESFTKGEERKLDLSESLLSRVLEYKDFSHVAIVEEGGRSITYKELIDAAHKCAQRITAANLRTSVVAIFYPRSIELVIAQLAALMCKVAFVPLDYETPFQRIESILNDAKTNIILANKNSKSLLPMGVQIFDVASNSSVNLNEASTAPLLSLEKLSDENDRMAYVIYTSGSTGTPKGVMISLLNLTSYTNYYINRLELIKNQNKTAMLYSPAFDASLADIWPTLCTGGQIAIPTKEIILSPESLQAWILEKKLTHVAMSTKLAEAVIKLTWPKDTPLKHILTGGEQLTIYPNKKIPFKMHNEYGPTETTIAATCSVVPSMEENSKMLPSIGKPIDNTFIYILDEHKNYVPIGVVGNLYVGGKGVGLGYFNNPDLTTKVFLSSPFRNGEKIYSTGDLARWRPDGTIEFCGRSDQQLKIRGQRIEPAEISLKIAEMPEVAESFVCAKIINSNEKSLVAYIVSKNGFELQEESFFKKVKSYLRTLLPSYMIPSFYVFVTSIPLNQNGKVDEKNLPLPLISRRVQEDTNKGAKFTTANEKILRSIWSQILQNDHFYPTDNFFDLGGHSLQLAQIQSSVKRDFNITVPLVKFFEYSSIQSLSSYIATLQTTAPSPDDNKNDEWQQKNEEMQNTKIQRSMLTKMRERKLKGNNDA